MELEVQDTNQISNPLGPKAQFRIHALTCGHMRIRISFTKDHYAVEAAMNKVRENAWTTTDTALYSDVSITKGSCRRWLLQKTTKALCCRRMQKMIVEEAFCRRLHKMMIEKAFCRRLWLKKPFVEGCRRWWLKKPYAEWGYNWLYRGSLLTNSGKPLGNQVS